MRVRALFVSLAFLAGCAEEAPPAASAMSCPPTLETQAEDGAPAAFAFRHVSFFEGDPSGLVELAPEESLDGERLTQVWTFPPAPRVEPIVMLCRYRGTEAVLRVAAPDAVSSCTLEGRYANGDIVGSPTLRCE